MLPQAHSSHSAEGDAESIFVSVPSSVATITSSLLLQQGSQGGAYLAKSDSAIRVQYFKLLGASLPKLVVLGIR